MVERIFAKNFKGIEAFEENLSGRNLFVGGVGSGKSARSQALLLLLTGAVPTSGVSKRQGDVFQTLCAADKDEMTVGAVIGGKEYIRTIKLTKDGGTRQNYNVDGLTVKKQDFDRAIYDLGIQIADTQAFLSLSDAKKVETLFALYPPAGDVSDMSRDIAKGTEALNRANAESKSVRDMAANLRRSRAEMELPAITLPEVRDQIAQIEKDLAATREEITTAKAEEEARIRAEAVETARKQAEDEETARKKAEEERLKAAETPKPQPAEEAKPEKRLQPGSLFDSTAKPSTPAPAPAPTPAPAAPQPAPVLEGRSPLSIADVEDAKSRILAAIENMECGSACAVCMVVKRELSKLTRR